MYGQHYWRFAFTPLENILGLLHMGRKSELQRLSKVLIIIWAFADRLWTLLRNSTIESSSATSQWRHMGAMEHEIIHGWPVDSPHKNQRCGKSSHVMASPRLREVAKTNWWHRIHDDVIKWKHFPRCWSFVRRIHRSPTQRPVTRSFVVFFDLCLNKRSSKQWWG